MPGLSDADVGLAPPPQQQQPQMLPGARQPLSPQATPNIGKQTGQVGLSDEEVGLGQQQQPAPQNSWSGAGKAALQGGVNAVSGLAGLPGDVLHLGAKALGYGDDYGKSFGSEAIQKGLESYTGHYDPQTRLEKYIRTGAEFAPGALLPAGELGIGAKLLSLVAAPAIASETAGQLTEGTAAEPYARIAGGIAGGYAGSKIANTLAARSVAAANPMQNAEQIGQTARAGFQSPELKGVQFNNGAIADLQDQMRAATLPKEIAQVPHGIIDTLNTPIGGKANFGWEDVQRARQLLGKEAGNFANPTSAGAAGTAKGALDAWLDNLNQGHLISGDAQAALQTYRTANANYQVMKTLDMLEGKRYAAELGAAAANSGANFENAMRQRIKGILISPKQRAQFENLPNGLGDQVIQAMEDVTRGGKVDNLIRALSNLVGGGGGMHAGLLGIGGFMMGHPEAALAPLAGWGLKAARNRSVNNQLGNITDMITQAAPANQGALAARNTLQQRLQGMSQTQRALVNAALARNQGLLTQQQTQ